MYPINSAILAKYQNGDKQYARITIGSTVIRSDRIMQGGFNVNRLSETDDTVKIGSCSAAEFTLVLNNRDGAYDDYDFIGKEAYVEVGVEYNNSVSYLPIGYFIFDEAGYDKSALRLASLDRMIKFERTIDPAQLTFPMTVTQLLGRLCTVCGVPLGTFPTLLNGGISITSLPKDAKTYRDLLVWIAEISGNVAYIDYSGNLMLGWYNGSQFQITPDIRRDGTLERGSILVTGVEIVVNDITTLAGTNARAIRVENNPLIPAGQESFIATGLFNKVGGFSYTPFSASVLPMPHIFPLDGATYVTASGDETYVPITSWTFTLNGGTKIAGTGNQATYRRGYGLADAILQGVNLADKAVTTDKIADNAVDTAQLAALAVKEGNLAANAVTEGKIAANAVVAGKIAAGAVTTDKLAALAVMAGNIASGAVTADKISVTDLQALGATIGGWSISTDSIYKIVTIGAYEYMVALNIVPNANEYSNAISVRRRPAGSSDQWTTLSGMLYGGYLYSVLADINGKITTKDLVANGKVRIAPDYDLQEVGEYAIELVDTENGISTNMSPDFINVGEVSGTITGTHVDGSTVQIGNGTSPLSSDYTSVYMMNLGQGSTGFLITEGQPNTAGYVETFVKGESIQIRKIRATGEDFIELKGSRMFIMDYVASSNATSYGRYTDAGASFGTVSGNAITDYLNGYAPGTYKTTIAQSQLKVNTHDLLKMMPSFAQMFATAITASANLNSVTYLACGQYYAATSTIAAGLTSCPVSTAFSMTVEAPNSTAYDNESDTGEAYRIRKLTVLGGEEWVQYCYKTSTTWTYGTWMQVSIGVSKDTYDNTNMKAGNLIARRNGNVVNILSTGNATSVAAGNWRTYVTIGAKYRPSEETPAIVTNAYGEVKTVRIRTNGNVDLYTGTSITSASNFAFTATYIVD